MKSSANRGKNKVSTSFTRLKDRSEILLVISKIIVDMKNGKYVIVGHVFKYALDGLLMSEFV